LKKIVIIAAVIGFLVPWFWLFMMFVMFNAKHGEWFYRLADFTCPSYLFPSLGFFRGDLISPFVNAALYAFIAFVWVTLKRRIKASREKSSS
jgi:hypothetical protein